MKRFAILFSLFLVFVILGCTGPEKTEPAAPSTVESVVKPAPELSVESTLRVGVASATVNPPNGTFLAGYGQNRRSTGVHDDLYVKAVVFDDGETPLALVVVDAISLQYHTVQDIRRAASSRVTKLSLPSERIIPQATHTHCAPDTIGIYGPDEAHTGFNQQYMNQLVQTAAEQVAHAVDRLQPARLVYAETECVGWAVNDSEPGVLDNSVTILQCLDAEGNSLATLTNFACHPTVLDGDTTLISADWVGAFYKAMAAAVPGEHLFLQGSVGAWIQPVTPERTFALAERYGKDLAEKTLAALRRAKPLDGTTIRMTNRVVQLPLHNELFKQMGAAGLIPREFGDTVETEVAWFAIGSAQFATHPGETAPMYTWETEKLMDTGPKFVLGLGIDHLGYFCPPHYFDDPASIPHAPYLTSMSPGKDAGPNMMAALAAVIP